MKKESTFVIGAGSFGTALSVHLVSLGQSVCLWSQDEAHRSTMTRECCNAQYLPDIPFSNDLTVCQTFSEGFVCRDILIVVPSQAFRDVIKTIKPYLKPHHRVLWGTKGLDPESSCLLHEVVEELLGDIDYAVLSGPSFAREVAKGSPTAVVIASSKAEFSRELTAKFSGGTFRAYNNDDIVGVQLGGAVKNVMALAVGISDGFGFGANARSALMTRGLAEMVRLGRALNANVETFIGLAGLGDLILTCTDDQSRNRRFGLAIGRGDDLTEAKNRIGQSIEGIRTTEQVFRLAKKHNVDMPITSMVYYALNGQLSIEEAVKTLLSRDVKSE